MKIHSYRNKILHTNLVQPRTEIYLSYKQIIMENVYAKVMPSKRLKHSNRNFSLKPLLIRQISLSSVIVIPVVTGNSNLTVNLSIFCSK